MNESPPSPTRPSDRAKNTSRKRAAVLRTRVVAAIAAVVALVVVGWQLGRKKVVATPDGSHETTVSLPSSAAHKPRLTPELPRWPAPASPAEPNLDDARVRQMRAFTLPNGAGGIVYARRSHVTARSPIDLVIELHDSHGDPLMSRGDTEVIVTRESDGSSWKASIMESDSPPGTYRSVIQPGDLARPTDITTTVIVSETGNPNAPGALGGQSVTVRAGLQARLQGQPRGQFKDGSLLVIVGVEALAPVPAVVRSELRASGRTLSEATAQHQLVPGLNEIALNFGPVVRPGTPEVTDLRLADLTLYVGPTQEWADLWTSPRAVIF
jgi:hypothetical protein